MSEHFIGVVSAMCDRCSHRWTERDVPGDVIEVFCPRCRKAQTIVWLAPAFGRKSVAVPERLQPPPRGPLARPPTPPAPEHRPLTRTEVLKATVFWGNVTLGRVMKLTQQDLADHVGDADLIRCEETCWAYLVSDDWGGKWPFYAVQNRWAFIRAELAYRRRKRMRYERPWDAKRGPGSGPDPFAGTPEPCEVAEVELEDEERPLEVGLRLPVDMIFRERYADTRVPTASMNDSQTPTDAQLRQRVARILRRRRWASNLTSLRVSRMETFAPAVLN